MAFLLKGARVVDPQLNLDAVLDVRIEGETIAEVAATVAPQEGDTVIDAKGKVLTPGLVDMHVHFRDPG
ncbi:MAG: dihydroorotase, partial [Atopobium sp.]|nr:dihydroorotase [Atopobium sp.]